LRALHPDIEQGAETVLDQDEAEAFVTARALLESAEAQYAFERNKLLKRMERDQHATVGDLRIASRRNTGKGSVGFYPNKSAYIDNVKFQFGEDTQP
jgi:hypothetical protein